MHLCLFMFGTRYVKFDTFTPAADSGLPVTRVISRMTLQEILVKAVGDDIVRNGVTVLNYKDDGSKVRPRHPATLPPRHPGSQAPRLPGTQAPRQLRTNSSRLLRSVFCKRNSFLRTTMSWGLQGSLAPLVLTCHGSVACSPCVAGVVVAGVGRAEQRGDSGGGHARGGGRYQIQGAYSASPDAVSLRFRSRNWVHLFPCIACHMRESVLTWIKCPVEFPD